MTDSAIVGRQVVLLYRNIPLGQLISIANATLLAWLWHDGAGPLAAGCWWLAAATVAAARLLVARAFDRCCEAERTAQPARWLQRIRLGALASGLVWAAGALLFMLGANTVQQIFTAFVMAGMAAGAILVLGTDRIAFRLFGWPVVIVTGLAFLGTDTLHIAFSVMTLLFLFVSTRSADHFAQTLQESLRLAGEKDVLLGKLELAKAAAEQSCRAKTEFLANISHELRTPMNGIVGMSDLLGMEALSPTQTVYLGHLQDAADELLVLIDNLIELSALDAGQYQLDPKPFALGDALPSLLAEAEAKARAKSLQFRQETDVGLPTRVSGDVDCLRKVLGHLTDNAVKFTEQGEVAVTAKLLQETMGTALVEFCVTDTGTGIPVDKLRAIFEPFTQADGSVTRRHGGAGVGLPISRKLSELMGGSLTVESRPGGGTTFRLCLPFALAAGDQAITGPCRDSSLRADRLPA